MTTTQNPIITVKELEDRFRGNVDDAITYAESLFGHRPSKFDMTKKPFLKNSHSSTDAKKYASELSEYEKLNEKETEKYNADKAAYDELFE